MKILLCVSAIVNVILIYLLFGGLRDDSESIEDSVAPIRVQNATLEATMNSAPSLSHRAGRIDTLERIPIIMRDSHLVFDLGLSSIDALSEEFQHLLGLSDTEFRTLETSFKKTVAEIQASELERSQKIVDSEGMEWTQMVVGEGELAWRLERLRGCIEKAIGKTRAETAMKILRKHNLLFLPYEQGTYRIRFDTSDRSIVERWVDGKRAVYITMSVTSMAPNARFAHFKE